MNDFKKLVQIFKIINNALREISNVGELRDNDLDIAVRKIYNTIEGLLIEVYRLMQGRK